MHIGRFAFFVQVADEINSTWKAHLYVKKLRLGDTQLSLVLNGTNGDYTVDALYKSYFGNINIQKQFKSGS